jgi:hypothetical protein
MNDSGHFVHTQYLWHCPCAVQTAERRIGSVAMRVFIKHAEQGGSVISVENSRSSGCMSRNNGNSAIQRRTQQSGVRQFRAYNRQGFSRSRLASVCPHRPCPIRLTGNWNRFQRLLPSYVLETGGRENQAGTSNHFLTIRLQPGAHGSQSFASASDG